MIPLEERIRYIAIKESLSESKLNKVGRENAIMKTVLLEIKKTTKDESLLKIIKLLMENVELEEPKEEIKTVGHGK